MNNQSNEQNSNNGFSIFKDRMARLQSANRYAAIGKYQDAIDVMEGMKGYQGDTDVVLMLGRLYQSIGDYDTAIVRYQQLLNLNTNKRGLLHLARALEEKAKNVVSSNKMELFEAALNTYLQIENWDNDRSVLLSLAPCYRAMGCNEDALWAYQRISPGKNIRQNRCIQEIIQNLQNILGVQEYSHESNLPAEGSCENDADMLIEQAGNLYWNQQYQEALWYYEQISDEHKDKQTFIQQAVCYESIGKYIEASHVFQKIYYSTQDTDALTASYRCNWKQQKLACSITSNSMFRPNVDDQRNINTEVVQPSLQASGCTLSR